MAAEFSTRGLRFMAALYRLCGRRALKVAALPVVAVAYLRMGEARRASAAYFRQSGARPRTFAHIRAFADSLVDKLAAWHGDIGPDLLDFRDPDVGRFAAHLGSGRGAFVLCSHLGNIDILRALAGSRTRCNAFMDTALTEGFNRFVSDLNPNANLGLYSTRNLDLGVVLALKERLEAGELAVMAADRVSAGKAAERLPFLGKPAPFPTGAFRFAKALGAPVAFLAVVPEGGRFAVHGRFFEAAPADMAAQYVAWLEGLVRAHPLQWFNFHDFWESGAA
ncbi:hypothetical protein FACS1894186_3850 [Alphaproteobacteria bacterium]|nr:hypothetical protein FACS1894186_3850 [Alphaproteobacteria bacterium]